LRLLLERMIVRGFGDVNGVDANDLGFSRDTSQHVEPELAYARNVVAVAAKAAGILSLDTPNVNFKSSEHLLKESHAVKQMGFKVQFIGGIDPNQIATLNSVFGVTEKEHEEAKKIVEAWENAQKEHGRGSTSVDGR
jgi:citrate lyase subunit beta/citryl-CoA lyase